MSDSDKSAPNRLLDKALLITLATPFAYYLAFEYDRGYINYFGIPDSIVDVSLRDLLFGLVALLSLAYTLLVVFDFVLRLLPDGWPPVYRSRTIWLCIAVIFAFLLVKVFEPPAWFDALMLVIVGAFGTVRIYLPIRRMVNAARSGRPIQQHPSSPQFDPYLYKGLAVTLSRWGIDPRVIPLFVGIYIVGMFATAFGDARARMQTAFLVHQPESDYSCVVLRARETELLCAEFDAKARKLSGNYQFIKSEGSTFSLRTTGRLLAPDVLSSKHPN